MRIIVVVGARPNFIKIGPLMPALQAVGVDAAVVHTGQHYDRRLSDVFFRDLELPEPEWFLGVGSGTHAVQTGKAMIALEEATTQLAVANEEYVVVEAAWKAENADFHQEYDALKQELAQLLAQRKQIAARVSKGDMSEYDSLRRLRKGLAVVAVQHATCTVCNVAIPQRDVDRAAQKDELYYCSGCDRILYVPED